MDSLALTNMDIIRENYQKAVDAVTGSTTSKSRPVQKNGTESFESILQSAINLVKETNALSNMASEEELNFSMGYTDNLHDLLVAQQKANLSLQYTVAIRNSVMDAYKEIMNLQF